MKWKRHRTRGDSTIRHFEATINGYVFRVFWIKQFVKRYTCNAPWNRTGAYTWFDDKNVFKKYINQQLHLEQQSKITGMHLDI